MKRILLALGLAAALCSPALADYIQAPQLCFPDGALGNRAGLPTCPPMVTGNEPWRIAQFAPTDVPGAVGVPPVAANDNRPVIVAPPAVIETGTIAGEVLKWVIAVGGGTLATILSGILVKVFQRMGVKITDELRSRLQEIVLNGLNAGARVAAERLAGKGKIEVKQAIVADAVRYTQAHGAETIKALGLDPTSPEAIEAIKARIETAIADPAVPTPPVLDPPAPPSLLGGGPAAAGAGQDTAKPAGRG